MGPKIGNYDHRRKWEEINVTVFHIKRVMFNVCLSIFTSELKRTKTVGFSDVT